MDRREHRPMLAVLLKFSSVALFTLMSAAAKYIGGTIPVGEVIAARCTIGIAAIVLIAWRTQNLHLLRTANWRSHALRSSAGALAMGSWFVAIKLAPIADATAASYAGPIFATLLAAPLLRERIQAHRWLAVALGFAGVLIMIGPRLAHPGAAAAGLGFALLNAGFAALGTILLRQMSRTEHALTTTFYFSLTSLCGAAATAAWGWPVPSARTCLLLVLIGLLGTSAQFLFSAALRYAEASAVMPVEYTGMVIAMLLGYLLFGEAPGVTICLGALLVIVAGLLIVWGEYRPNDQIAENARATQTRAVSRRSTSAAVSAADQWPEAGPAVRRATDDAPTRSGARRSDAATAARGCAGEDAPVLDHPVD